MCKRPKVVGLWPSPGQAISTREVDPHGEADGHRLMIARPVTGSGATRAGLVDRLIITRAPVLIGEGVPLFGRVPSDIRLEHVQTRAPWAVGRR